MYPTNIDKDTLSFWYDYEDDSYRWWSCIASTSIYYRIYHGSTINVSYLYTIISYIPYHIRNEQIIEQTIERNDDDDNKTTLIASATTKTTTTTTNNNNNNKQQQHDNDGYEQPNQNWRGYCIIMAMYPSSIGKGGGGVVCMYYITYVRYIIFYWYKIHCLLTAFFFIIIKHLIPFLYTDVSHYIHVYTHIYTHTHTHTHQSETPHYGQARRTMTSLHHRPYHHRVQYHHLSLLYCCSYLYVYYYDVFKRVKCMYLSSSLLLLNPFEAAAAAATICNFYI